MVDGWGAGASVVAGAVLVSRTTDDRDNAEGKDVTVGPIVPEQPVTMVIAPIAKIAPLTGGA